jgi:glucan 1,3-beta-glucosidase
VLVLLGVLATERALGLAFDPRYRDFGFAPLTAAIVPYLVVAFLKPSAGVRGAAEIAMAGVLALCAVYIAINESIENWQALWCSVALLALSVTLLRSRAAPG